VRAAARKASWRSNVTPDDTGMTIIETLDQHNPGSLHVLALVNGILLRTSRR
jgi:hypothetical protein